MSKILLVSNLGGKQGFSRLNFIAQIVLVVRVDLSSLAQNQRLTQKSFLKENVG